MMQPTLSPTGGQNRPASPAAGASGARGPLGWGTWLATWLPVPLALLLLLVLALSSRDTEISPTYLVPVLNTAFLTITACLLTLLGSRHFLRTGRRAVLLLACSMVAMAMASFAGGLGFPLNEPNIGVTVFNSGMLIAALCNLVAAVMYLLPPVPAPRRPALVLALSLGSVASLIGLLIGATRMGWVPPFFIPGEGSTLLRQFVLASAVGTFAIAALLLGFANADGRSSFLRWYAVGLGLLAVGIAGMFAIKSLASPLAWAGRCTQYLGGIYQLVAVVHAIRQSGRFDLPLHEALRLSEERYHTLFSTMTEGFALHELVLSETGEPIDYVFLDINPAFERLTGLRREDVLGRTFRSVLPNEDPEWVEIYGKVALTGEPVQLQRFVATLGRHYEVYGYRTGPLQFAVIFLDVTERKEAEEQLKAATAAAETASRAKDLFLAVLSHELRTPLAPALMLVSAHERSSSLPEQLRQDLTTIRRCIELETRIIDDLLDISRVTTGKMHLQLQAVSLHAVLSDSIATCSNEFHDAQLEVRTQFDAPDHHVGADAARLQQVFWNLLKNAIKFTPPGGRVVVATSNPSRGRIEVRVTDTGVGIAPEATQRIFAAFEQGETGRSRLFGGLGLGLAISRAIVELHGGTIAAESAGMGKGATLIVSLATVPAAAPASVPTAPAAATEPLRILVVEDHPETARTVSRLLRVLGHEVHVSGSVAEATARLAEARPDLLLSDLGLPDGSGNDIVRHLRARGDTTPALCMSGYGMESDLDASRAAGFAVHLVKPIDLGRLEAAIAEVAGARSGNGRPHRA